MFSSLLGKELNKQNIKTLIIDFDILNNSIHTIFGTKNKSKKLIKKESEKNNLNKINIKDLKIKINKNLDLICGTNLLFNNLKEININVLIDILEKVKKEYSVIIIDTSSECIFNYTKLILEKSNKIIFLVEPNLLEVKKGINLLKIYLKEWDIKKEKINIIFNKYNIYSIDEKILKNIFFEFNIIGKINLNKKYNLILNKNMKIKFKYINIKKQYKKIINNIFNKGELFYGKKFNYRK